MIILYIITNLVNGKSYIGWTVKDLKKRWDCHKCPSSPCALLRKAIQKYGWKNFKPEVLVICPSEQYAKELEVKAIKVYNTKVPNGYNLTDGGEGMLGFRHSEKTKQKMSGKRKGKTYEQLYGQERALEIKQNLSESHKGQPSCWLGKHLPAETIRKRTETRKRTGACKGKKLTEDHKRKISEANKGKRLTEEHKRKLSIVNKGKRLSEKTKQKISETMKRIKGGSK